MEHNLIFAQIFFKPLKHFKANEKNIFPFI